MLEKPGSRPPSTILWSNVKLRNIRSCPTTFSPSITGRRSILPIPRIADSGTLMIGLNLDAKGSQVGDGERPALHIGRP